MESPLSRAILFLTFVSFFILLEYIIPSQKRNYKNRFKLNWILLGLNIILIKIFFPLGIYKITTSFDLLDLNIIKLSDLSPYLSIPLTIIIFDFAIYLQHIMFHKDKFLWKTHTIHHSDRSLDFSNGFRFHPAEIVISGAYKALLIIVFGPNILSFALYETILNSMAIFNHSNIKINPTLDKYLKYIIVTPSFHRTHHSPKKQLTNSNFGNIFSFWDKVFRTYSPDENNDFGLEKKDSLDHENIFSLLSYPFKK